MGKDWIEYIVKEVIRNYNGRKIVLWGKYAVSDDISSRLKENYGIETAFYVDSDSIKVDGKQVLSPDCLCGKKEEYYVVISVAFYHTIRNKLGGYGYTTDIDYYYFCDCALRQEAEYYEDAHGNKIIGKYRGLKFVFSGFDSVIEIGEGVLFQDTSIYVHSDSRMVVGDYCQFRDTSIYVHNDAKMVVGDHCQFRDTSIYVHNDAKMVVGDHCQFQDTSIYVHNASGVVVGDSCQFNRGNNLCIQHLSEVILGKNIHLSETNIGAKDSVKLRIKCGCEIRNLSIRIEEEAELIIGKKVLINSKDERKTEWEIGNRANLKIGNKGRFSGRAGYCCLGKNALLKIGKKFSVNGNYHFVLNFNTNICIGNDCMFSYDIHIRSNDGHSIFDTETRKNINSSYKINKTRKVIIGDHVWIGERCNILYNTRIGDGSIIGAMSLVKGKIPNNCIAAGIPARVIRKNIAWCRKNGAEDIMECGKKYIRFTEEK